MQSRKARLSLTICVRVLLRETGIRCIKGYGEGSDERRKNQIFPWETWEEDRTVKRRRGWRKREIKVKFYHIAKAEGWLAHSIHHAANVTKLGLVSCALTVFEVIIKTHGPWTQPIYTRTPAIITWSLAWHRGWTYTTGTTVSGSQGINCLGSM